MEIQQTLNDKAQAKREDGQLLIQTPNNGAAAALSTLPFGLSAGEVTNISLPLQENGELFRFEEDAVSTAYTFTSAAEAINIETQKKSAGRLEDDSKENPRSPITDFDAIIQLLIELAKNTSKVVDEYGEPLVVYHGTKAVFAVFDASHNHKANKGFF